MQGIPVLTFLEGLFKKWIRTKLGRLILAALSVLIYCIAYIVLRPVIGNSVTLLSIFPVIVIGSLYGAWQGVVGAVITVVISILLIFFTRFPVIETTSIVRGIVDSFFLMVLGGVIGSENELRHQLRRELELRQAAVIEITKSEERYRSLFENSADGIFLMDETFIDCNQQACLLFNCERGEIIGHTPGEFSPQTQPDGQLSSVKSAEKIREAIQGAPQVFTWQHKRKGGNLFDAEITLKAVRIYDQSLILAVLRDLTEQRAIEQSERDHRLFAEALSEVASILTSALELDELLEKILATADRVVPHDGANIALLDNTMIIERVARASKNALGQYTYKSGIDTFSGTAVITIAGLYQMSTSGRPLVIPDVTKYPGWKVFPESEWVQSFVGAPIRVQGKTVGFINLDSATVGFYQLVHGEKLAAFADLAAIAIHNANLYERAQQQAVTDELTRLYNRRGLMDLGKNEAERSRRFGHNLSILMIDVDNFKKINDLSGYQAGDEVLAMLAGRLRAHLRSIDIAGRYGGDEFVIFLPETPLEGAMKVADRIRLSVTDNEFKTSAGALQVSISVGATMLTPPQMEIEFGLEQAGAALHAAKFSGKNRISG